MAEKPKDIRYPAEIKTVGDKLRVKRLELGLYQREVAKLIGVTEDSVCYWESGRVKPSRKMRSKLDEFLRIFP
jgi:DNA-binding XRE family transcriptional regulator